MNIYKPKDNVIYKFVERELERFEPTPTEPSTITVAWSGTITDISTGTVQHTYTGNIEVEVNPVSITPEYPYAYCGYFRNYHNTSGDDWVCYSDLLGMTSPTATNPYSIGDHYEYNEAGYTVDYVNYEMSGDFNRFPYTGSYGAQIGSSDSLKYEFEIDATVPIFDTKEHCMAFILNGSDVGLLNGTASWELEETNLYYIYNQRGNAQLYNGSITEPNGATKTWESMRFNANSRPVLYFTEGTFNLHLVANNVVNSKATTGPGYTIDYVPEEGWTNNALEYTGLWYGDVNQYGEAFGNLPDNGTYMYGYIIQTNIPIFEKQADAEEALETGDYDKAINSYDLETNPYAPPKMDGTAAEDITAFGDGAVTSPFVQTYIMSRNDVLNVANAFYSNDPTIIDNIKKGLELFGASPYESLCGLTYYPFSGSSICTTASQNYIYFGSYKHEGVNVDKVVSLTQGAYINAGTVTLTPVERSFRNFEPYCGLSVYLPYIGWQKLRIADYINKTVNVRYYVDIMTRACAVALVANNVIIDYFTGEIGINLPITGQNLSQYANSTMNALLGTAGGAIGGAATGAMIGGSAGLALGPVGMAGLALGGAAIGAGSGIFKMSQKGAPKDHNTTKGNFSSGIGSYLPQYVIFRFDVHDLIIPDKLTELYGRPSAASGKVRSFSGFLQADTVKLNNTGMSEEDASEVVSLLKDGIFV